jgi:hypothetical protein
MFTNIVFADFPGIEYIIPSDKDINQKLNFQITLVNNSAVDTKCMVEYSLQNDSNMTDTMAPDSIFGINHAMGKLNWTEYEEKKIDDKSLTDGLEWTGVDMPWKADGYKEIDQYIDLGTTRDVSKIEILLGDSNWIWLFDIAGSLDGKQYMKISDLNGINMNKKNGKQAIILSKSFSTRFLKFHYYPTEGVVANKFCLPTEIAIYDGITDEKIDIPVIGNIVDAGKQSILLSANETKKINFESNKVIGTGGYFLAIKTSIGNETKLKFMNYFVMPSKLEIINADSKFGINGASLDQIPMIRKLGVGWVRFENMKAPMISPKAGIYKYDGKVGPWYVNHDAIMKGYADSGLQVLPYLFQSPSYNTTSPKTSKHAREYPPDNFDTWADFCYQTVARYGKTIHPVTDLKTSDKTSGLGIINTFEIWNEPNLDNPDWGAWVGTMPKYLELLRKASQSVKLADKTAKVTNGGFAGIDLHDVDMLRTYQYDDNTHPIDYVDIINVHYYTGRSSPETATVNTNIKRGNDETGVQTYEDMLNQLADWRKLNGISKPIWLTETGYDTGGPKGINEQVQAAWLPRDIMIALGAGIDKVFVYREKGSTPSLYAASGLVRDDNSLKPAWFTYATLIRQLNQITDGMRLPYPDENIRLYLWEKEDNIILSAWTVTGKAELKLNLGKSKYIDSFGVESRIKNGEIINLGIFPIYISEISSTKEIEVLKEKSKIASSLRLELLRNMMKKKVVLFDFGGVEHVGSINYGSVRNAIPITCKNVWDDEKGYGFKKTAMRDGDKAWINDFLERDFTVMSAGLPFKFILTHGKYRLSISANPFGQSAQMTIKGVADENVNIKVNKNEKAIELDIDANDDPISIEFDQYTELHWMMAVEKD